MPENKKAKKNNKNNKNKKIKIKGVIKPKIMVPKKQKCPYCY